MRKALVVLILAALVLPVFAEDALVLPKGVIRVSVPMSYGFGDQRWDKDGDAIDIIHPLSSSVPDTMWPKSDGFNYVNIGLAVEYGVNDWITAAVQWTPGWNFSSSMGFDNLALGPTTLYTEQAKLGSFFDLFVGAKLQIIGPKAPSKSDTMRFSVAPGVKIPLAGASITDVDPTKDEAYVLLETDKHLWGMGTRLYFDYIVNQSFFVNLFSEFVYFPEQKLENGVKYQIDDAKIAVGYDLILEVEPQYQMPIADGLTFKAGLPLTYKIAPDYKVDGTTQSDTGTSILTMTPNVGLFFMKTFMPIELEAGYRIPLMGVNEPITNVVYLVAKFYAKF